MNTLVFAHRGASGYAPENTLDAFEEAVRMGADGVELDVHICRTGELVVAHDETVDRVSDGTGYIRDLSLSELKALYFNRTFPAYKNARLPLLSEVLQLLQPTGLRINIELKNSIVDYPDLEKRVLESVDRWFERPRVLFSSFNHYSMLRMKQLDPSVFCGLLYEAALVHPWEYAAHLGMDAIHPHYSEVLLNSHECTAAHDLGIHVNVWTVNTPEAMASVIQKGTDILITNYPDQALKMTARG